jgi:hypothetical protein
MCAYAVATPLFTSKSILRQKKKYVRSHISPCQNIIFKQSSKRNQNPSRYYNSITNLKFPTQAKIVSFKNPHIKIELLRRGPKSLKLLHSIMNMNRLSWPWEARPTNWDE